MGVFDDLIHIGENGELLFNQWIEWDHFLIPNKPEWFRELLINIMALFGHCMNCTSLSGTIFYSGWMLYPEGKIKNTTPFGGWVK